MTLIDWAYLGANFLRIFGLSIILAAFSYHAWLRQQHGRPLSALFRERSWRAALYAGLSLMIVAITVMPRSERWFIRLGALVIALTFAAAGVRTLWQRRYSD
jgi:hypothetical protein